MADPFYESGYPALHDAANQASLEGQRHFLWALRTKLYGLLAASAGGALLIGTPFTKAGAIVVLVAFILAFFAEVYTSQAQPEKRWYEGRAAAESVKTLAWRYAVGGESFPASLSAAEADSRFTERVMEVLHDLGDLELSNDKGGDQLTKELRDARNSSFSARKSLYKAGRLQDQRAWYTQKARWNRRRWKAWLLASLAGQALGIALGALMVAGIVAFDVVGVIAAGVATVAGWTQAKQYSTLSTAYSVTAQELAAVLGELESIDSDDWANYVGQAEEAISREHTLWRASRGVRFRAAPGG